MRSTTTTRPPRNEHAIVIGGSMAGLLTARVLLDHFERVTVIERDELVDAVTSRTGVPQARHTHLLLLKGLEILEHLFPGIEEELVADGAVVSDLYGDARMLNPLGWMPRFHSGLKNLAMTRDFLEWHVRRRLCDRHGVELRAGLTVSDLAASSDRRRIEGVWTGFGTAGGAPELVRADLVVDASGRGSHTPQWLKDIGYQTPVETTVDSKTMYVTRWYAASASDSAQWKFVSLSGPHRTGMMLLVEGQRWLVSMIGRAPEHEPPRDEDGFLEYASTLPDPLIYDVLRTSPALGPVFASRSTASRRLRYDRMHLPEGLVVLGDAACTFNPTFAQGMSVAALGAMTLDACLRDRRELDGLGQDFHRKLAKVHRFPWLMATSSDRRGSESAARNGRRGPSSWPGAYVKLLFQLGVRDPEILIVFSQVGHLIRPPTALVHVMLLRKALHAKAIELLRQPRRLERKKRRDREGSSPSSDVVEQL